MTAPATPRQRPPLRRGLDTPVAGVCLGLARHLNLSAPVVRAAMIGLTVAGGIGLVLYCWLWVFVPAEDEPLPEAGVRGLSGEATRAEAPEREGRQEDAGRSAGPPADPESRLRRVLDSLTGSPEVLAGGLLLGVAGILALQVLGLGIDWWFIGPAAVLVIGVLLAWSQVDAAGFRPLGSGGAHGSSAADPAPGEPSPILGLRHRQAALWQFAAGAFLVLVALLVMAGGFIPAGELILSLVLAGMLLAGVALVVAPWLIKLYRTMSVERARAAAEAERADIAAHLHDSVLQTLAMIQKQRHDPAAVESLARGQERQLRSWLYRNQRSSAAPEDRGEPAVTLKERLIDVAAELEALHSSPVEMVAVGESRRTDHSVLVAATREAIVNALRHAGPASVYVESGAGQDAVFIRDRGGGFDVEAVLADRVGDRLGVRESIVGRMRRAGGEARIRSGERGTEVQLFMPVEAPAAEEQETSSAVMKGDQE